MTKYRWLVDQLIAGWARVRCLSIRTTKQIQAVHDGTCPSANLATAHSQIEAMRTFSFLPVRLEFGLATLKLNAARLWQGFPRFSVQLYPAVQLGREVGGFETRIALVSLFWFSCLAVQLPGFGGEMSAATSQWLDASQASREHNQQRSETGTLLLWAILRGISTPRCLIPEHHCWQYCCADISVNL